MKIYKLSGHVTLSDLALALDRPRQTIWWWIVNHRVPHTKIMHGKKALAIMVPTSEIPTLRALNKELLAR